MLNVKRKDMAGKIKQNGKKDLCKNCIWEKTIKPLTKHFFECKGTGRLMAVTEKCEVFEHKDYPKKITYRRRNDKE